MGGTVRNRTLPQPFQTIGAASRKTSASTIKRNERSAASFVACLLKAARVSPAAAKGYFRPRHPRREDELLVRSNIAEWLRDAGCVVVESDSGEAAIALCKSDMPIDLVFTDINLGGAASGWDVAETFRRYRPNVPVLYTSGKPTTINASFPAACSSPSRIKATMCSRRSSAWRPGLTEQIPRRRGSASRCPRAISAAGQ